MLVNFPKSFKLFGAMFLLFSFVYAVEPIVTVKQIDKVDEYTNEIVNIESTDEDEAESEEKYIYLEYEKTPTEIYKNQIIELNVKSIITKNKILDVTSIFTGEEGIKILNPNSKWIKTQENRFDNKYYIQALENDIKIPDLIATFTLDKDTNIDEVLDGFYSSTQPVMGSNDYSSVLAKTLEVKHHKTTRYDNNYNILVLEMESKIGNLYDFHIENSEIKSQGIDNTFIKMPDTKIVYFAVIPIHWKKFRFEYFNIETDRFDVIEIPIIIDTENISTQSDLNPKDSPFELYKVIILGVVVLLLLILSIVKKSKLFSFMTVIVMIFLILEIIPYKKLTIGSEAKIRLLPTKNSTIFYITDQKSVVSEMKKIGEYRKIMFDNGKIGWVNEKDIIKN
jgi:hypothetical protein